MTVSVVSWTTLNDAIYAFQDIEDDLKADVKSMAIRHKHHAKLLFKRLADRPYGLGCWDVVDN